jgi:tetratricopeptide (TPR) repeat protein
MTADALDAAVIGRAAELGVIREVVEAARAGTGTTLVISGEAGIGKTALAEAAVAEAGTRGMRAVHGRCWDGEAAPPHWLWLQVLRSLGVTDAEALVHGRGAQPSAGRVGVNIAGALAAAARREPLLVLLEDLHDGGPDAIRVLPLLAATLQTEPIVLLGTFRRATARAAEGVPEVLRSLAGTHLHLELEGLDVDDVRRLLDGAGGRSSARHAARVHAATAGNPLLVSLLGASAGTRQTADGVGSEGHLDREPPEQLRAHVRRQIGPLPAATQAVLSRLSVLSRTTSVDVLAAVEGVDAVRLRALLLPAVEEGVVEVHGDAVRFRHGLVRAALHADLPIVTKARLHETAARALAALAPDDARVRAEVTHHRFHADLGEGPSPSLAEELRRAAEAARAGGAIEEAAVLLSHAAGCAERAGASPTARGELLLELAVAQERAGLSQAPTTWEAGVALARLSGEPVLLARAAIGSSRSALFLGVVSTRQVTVLEEALAALDAADQDLPALRCQVLGALASALHWTPERHRSMELADEAVRIARTTDAPRALAGALLCRHFVTRGPAHAAERIGIAQEAAAAADAVGDDEFSATARSSLVVDHRERGDCTAADVATDALRSWAAAKGHTQGLRLATVHELVAALLDGDAGREADLRDEVHRAAAAEQRVGFLIDFARVMTDLGPLDERLRFVVRSRARRLPQQPSWRARALLDAAVEGVDGTAAELGALVTTLQTRGHDDSHWLLAATLAAEAAVVLEDEPRAAALLQMLSPHADAFVVSGRVGAARGSVRHHLGILLLAVGRTDEALRMLQQADRLHGRPGFGAHRARTRAALATAATAAATSRRLGARGPAPAAEPFLLTRAGAYWTLDDATRPLTLPDSKGMRYLARLVRTPDVEIPALALYRLEGSDRAGAIPHEVLAIDLGGSDAVLDATAKRAYRDRLEAIEQERAWLSPTVDADRLRRLEEERAALAEMLSAAVGLGGRDRRLPSEGERARTSVTKALRAAVGRVRVVHVGLADHLDATVRTGARCGYLPQGRPALVVPR